MNIIYNLVHSNSFTYNLQPMNTPFTLDLRLFKAGAAITRAVNNKVRQKMLFLLHKKGCLTVTELKQEMKLEQSITSSHLRILREVGFVTTQRDGSKIYYSINYEKLNEVQDFLKMMV